MKRLIAIPIFCMVLFLLLAPCTNAQTYSDYVLGGIIPNTSVSLVRYYGPDQAVVYYVDATSGDGVIGVVDMSGNLNYVDLDPGFSVNDMEINNDYLFMCGQTSSNKGFIAAVYIPDILSGNATVKYNVSTNTCTLRKMVAYSDTIGTDWVVVIGSEYYTSNYPTMIENNCAATHLSHFDPCSSSCRMDFVLLAYNPQYHQPTSITHSPTPYTFYIINDKTNPEERLDDIVITKNKVATVGMMYIGGKPYLAVHQWNKARMMTIHTKFQDRYCYPMTGEDLSDLLCCRMGDDTIAVASHGEYLKPGWSDHDTRIRMIDLSTMAMTGSQAYDLEGYKTWVQDMAYIPENHTLVVLEDMKFPRGSLTNQSTFLFLEPYNTFLGDTTTSTVIVDPSLPPTPPSPVPYMANGFYELMWGGAFFYSIDRVSGDHYFLSTGGDYWMLKDAPVLQSSQNCYKVGEIEIHKIDDLPEDKLPYVYNHCSEYFTITHEPKTTVSTSCGPNCYVP